MTINSEVLAGLIFLFFGIAAIAFGWEYGFGTPRQLGAGALPALAGTALLVLGGVQLVRAIGTGRQGRPLPSAFSRSELRPLLLILVAVFAFGLLVIPTGLVPALAALIGIAWFAEAGGRRWELPVAMVVVIVTMIAIFNLGLGLPIRLFAWRF